MMKLVHTAIKRNAEESERMACVSLLGLRPITDNNSSVAAAFGSGDQPHAAVVGQV
jgi:hypothetical protein